MDTCIISETPSTSCSSQVSAYESALAKLTSDKLAAWQSIFAEATSTTPGVNLMTALDNANAAKHAAFKTAFGSMKDSPTVQSNPQ